MELCVQSRYFLICIWNMYTWTSLTLAYIHIPSISYRRLHDINCRNLWRMVTTIHSESYTLRYQQNICAKHVLRILVKQYTHTWCNAANIIVAHLSSPTNISTYDSYLCVNMCQFYVSCNYSWMTNQRVYLGAFATDVKPAMLHNSFSAWMRV